MRAAILSFYDFEEVRGGTELFCRHLRPAFTDSEHITFSTSREMASGFPLTRLNLEFARMAWAIDRELKVRHKKKPFDVMICSDITGLATRLTASDLPGIMVFHFAHKSFSEETLGRRSRRDATKLIAPLLEQFAAVGKTVVAVSAKLQRALRGRYGIEARLIENGIPLDQFRPYDKLEARRAIGIGWKGPLGIFVGRTDRSKGFDIVQEIARTRKDIRVLCVSGDGHLGARVFNAQNVDNSDMPLYYSAADFLFFPSRYDSLSYTAIEAIACDLPVVASRTGIFEDVDPRRVGVVLDSEDPRDYSEAIDSVLQMDIHPRSLAIERFSVERFRRQWVDLVSEVVSSRAA
jgi:glycosyltransferase involved in cell wall biosynthesis